MQITLSRLSNSVLGSLADQSISISKKAKYTAVKDHPLLVALETEFAGYITVFGKSAFSGLGSSVEKADMKRDGVFLGMKTMLSGMLKLPSFPNQQNAVDLFTVFQNRGLDINTYSYNDETTEMDKLISELSTPANVAKLDSLYFTPYFESLKLAQSEFKAIYAEQLAVNSSLRLELSATSTRRNLEATLRNYLSVVEGMKSVSGWTELHAELNELTKSIRNSKISPRSEEQTPPVV
jgi:hypothetical protein